MDIMGCAMVASQAIGSKMFYQCSKNAMVWQAGKTHDRTRSDGAMKEVQPSLAGFKDPPDKSVFLAG
jgi:hypothetical protein